MGERKPMNEQPILKCDSRCSAYQPLAEPTKDNVTQHAFVGERYVPGAPPAFEQLYQCNACGARRRFGLTDSSLVTGRRACDWGRN
jgi:hypothetical protein